MEKEYFYIIKGQESKDAFIDYDENSSFVYSQFIFKTQEEAMQSLIWSKLSYDILLDIANNNFNLSNKLKYSYYVFLNKNDGEHKISLFDYENKEIEMLELLKNTNEVYLQTDELNIVHYSIEKLELYSKDLDRKFY